MDDSPVVQPADDTPPSAPRWVKAWAMVAVALVLLFVLLHITGNTPLHTP